MLIENSKIDMCNQWFNLGCPVINRYMTNMTMIKNSDFRRDVTKSCKNSAKFTIKLLTMAFTRSTLKDCNY